MTRRRGPVAVRSLRRPAPPGDPPALRLPARDRGRPGVVGGPQGPDARLGDPADGGPRRGPPDRVLRLRGRHPRAAVRRRRRDRLGLGHLGSRGADARRAQGDRGRRAQVRAQRREAARPVHDRPDRRPSRRGDRDGRSRTTREQWLLIHKRGRRRRPRAGTPRTIPTSVKTGRTNDEVKANTRRDLDQPGARRRGRDRPVASARGARCPATSSRCSRRSPARPSTTRTGCSRSSGTGTACRPWSATARSRLFTRNGQDAETYFRRLLSPPSWIDAREAIVDGEVVALDEDGAPDFSLLQERISELRAGGRRTSGPLVYQAFDLLHLRRAVAARGPARERKRLLKTVLREHPRVRFAAHVDADGLAFHAAAEERGLEGIVAKRGRSRYEPGRRSSAWLKIKIRPEQELVVGGWTPGEGNARDLGALASASTRTAQLRVRRQGRLGLHGRDPQAAARAARRRSSRDDPPFDPPPERKGELRERHAGSGPSS